MIKVLFYNRKSGTLKEKQFNGIPDVLSKLESAGFQKITEFVYGNDKWFVRIKEQSDD